MLKATVERDEGKTLVVLEGRITEEANSTFLQILPKLLKTSVVFDCSGIFHVNSVGFRGWVQFLRSLSAHAEFKFVNCSTTYLEYAGLLSTSAFAMKIESVVIPFRCELCRHEDSYPYDIAQLVDGGAFAERVCMKCNGLAKATYDMDEIIAMCGPREPKP